MTAEMFACGRVIADMQMRKEREMTRLVMAGNNSRKDQKKAVSYSRVIVKHGHEPLAKLRADIAVDTAQTALRPGLNG